MASGPITSWEIDGETVETVSDFIFGDSKITADGDFSREIKRCLLLGRKVMTNLDSILKTRAIDLPTKVCLVKAMVFPVVMYGCESWTVKKAERQRIDAFELWCWRRVLRVPWTARRSNQSILKEISPGCSLEGMLLKLKLQYFGHLMWRVDSLEKTLAGRDLGAGGEGDDRGWDGWMASPTRWTWVWVNSGSWWWTGRPGMLWLMGLQRVRHNWATELNWYRIRWRRQWQPTPILLPGKSHGRSLVCFSPWGHLESDTTEWLHFHFHALEKEMATHSSVLAWRIPETGEPGELPSMGSHRVRHDWGDLAAAAAAYRIRKVNKTNKKDCYKRWEIFRNF